MHLFGIPMPFIRSYGLNIGYDSAALLATIAVAYLAVARGSRPKLVLAVLFVIFVVVFQARGMVLQVVLATALIPILRFPRRALFIIPVVVLGLVLISARGSDAGTTISSQARQLTDAQTLDDLKHHPASFLEGRDADAYFRSALASGGSGLVAAFPRFSTLPVHNFFLNNLVSGGFAAFLLISAAYVTMLWTAATRWRREPSDLTAQALLLAAILVSFESMIEPVSANIAGVWLVMGFVLGRGAQGATVPMTDNALPARSTRAGANPMRTRSRHACARA